MIKYPDGKQYQQKLEKTEKNNVQQVNYSNRGMLFEEAVNQSNLYYLEHGIAIIHKKPTPIQIVKVDYPARSAAVIKEAYYKLASTTDYNGVYRGRYIDFEAKETRQKSFPLKNLHEHQVKHMQQVRSHGGIAFVLLHFVQFDEIYFIPIEKLLTFWDRMVQGGRKSMTRTEAAEIGELIKFGLLPRIDYIKIIQELYE